MSTYEFVGQLEPRAVCPVRGDEPQALLEWAIEDSPAASADLGGVPGRRRPLIDMAYGIDPNVRIFTRHGDCCPARDALADRRGSALSIPA